MASAFPASCRAEVVVLEGTVSPDGRFAFASDDAVSRSERIWRVALPSNTPIGEPFRTDNFIGLASRSYAVWNMRAARVALEQGGIPFERTKVFQYSSRGLRELPIPTLEGLPDKWYPAAAVHRCYISARRWIGRDRIKMSVSGSLSYGEYPRRFFNYSLTLIIKFSNGGRGRIVSIEDAPLETL